MTAGKPADGGLKNAERGGGLSRASLAEQEFSESGEDESIDHGRCHHRSFLADRSG